MRFSVLALDFDGTIARNDVLDPDVRTAIGELRSQDVVVIIVTGRILEDLRRVVGDLHFVDAVVAENGASMEFPDSGYTTRTGAPPPPHLLEELRRQGIPFHAGQSVVEADAGDAARLLAVVQRLELPLVLAFNRGRVMLLPQAISKATGLLQALTILRLSPHNAVAIGDAENDHELLRACEVGVAVEWGSPALQATSDYVLPGEGPHEVADYIRALANRRRVPSPIATRRRLLLGHADDGRPLSLAVRGRNVLVAGDPKSGKSWVTGLMCEQLILYGYCLCIIDPEGDYASLEALPGVRLLGGADPLPRPRELLRALRHPDVSVVLDLSHADQQTKRDYLRAVLPALALLRRRTGLPHRVVLDEAHYFLHDSDVVNMLDLELNGYTLVTYSASRLHPDVLAASQAIVVTRESEPSEVRRLFRLCRTCSGTLKEAEWQTLLGTLVVGDAVVLPITEEAQGEVRRHPPGAPADAPRAAPDQVHRRPGRRGTRVRLPGRRDALGGDGQDAEGVHLDRGALAARGPRRSPPPPRLLALDCGRLRRPPAGADRGRAGRRLPRGTRARDRRQPRQGRPQPLRVRRTGSVRVAARSRLDAAGGLLRRLRLAGIGQAAAHDAIPERGALDTQQRGRPGLVAARLPERFLDQVALEAAHPRIQRLGRLVRGLGGLRRGPGGAARGRGTDHLGCLERHAGRQAPRPHLPADRRLRDALAGVLELAHVARPGVPAGTPGARPARPTEPAGRACGRTWRGSDPSASGCRPAAPGARAG